MTFMFPVRPYADIKVLCAATFRSSTGHVLYTIPKKCQPQNEKPREISFPGLKVVVNQPLTSGLPL